MKITPNEKHWKALISRGEEILNNATNDVILWSEVIKEAKHQLELCQTKTTLKESEKKGDLLMKQDSKTK